MVLYTNQKTKKAKTWHDGSLKFSGSGTKGVLYDDKKLRIDTIHVRPEDVGIGEQLESDRHYILIEEESKIGAANQNGEAQSQAVVGPIKIESLKPQIRTGLKRRHGGFVPPRMIAPRDPEPLQQKIIDHSSQSGSRECPGSQNTSQHVASFQQRYNILKQCTSERSLSMSNNSDLMRKASSFSDNVLQKTPEINMYNNLSSPVIGQTNNKPMATSPWSTFGSSQSPASSKFKSWQDSNTLEPKNVEVRTECSCEDTQAQLVDDINCRIPEIPKTSQSKRSSTQILALLTKTVDKPNNRKISPSKSQLQMSTPPFLSRKPDDVKGEPRKFVKDKAPAVSLESLQKGKEKQCSQWNNLQDDSLSYTSNLVQSDLTNSSPVSDHNTNSFRADSKNQPDDNHYDLISTPTMETCRAAESEMKGKVVCDCEHIGINEPQHIETNEPQHSGICEPQYMRICELQNSEMNVSQHNGICEPQHSEIHVSESQCSGIYVSQHRGMNEPQHSGICEPQYSKMNVPQCCEMNESSHGGICEPQYSEINVPQCCKMNESSHGGICEPETLHTEKIESQCIRMNKSEQSSMVTSPQHDEVCEHNDLSPYTVNENTENCNSAATSKCGIVEEENEMACFGGASFSISFSPLSVIPPDSDSDLDIEDQQKSQSQQDQGNKDSSITSRVGESHEYVDVDSSVLCTVEKNQEHGDVGSSAPSKVLECVDVDSGADQNRDVSHHSLTKSSGENEPVLIQKELEFQKDINFVKKTTQINSETLFKDTINSVVKTADNGAKGEKGVMFVHGSDLGKQFNTGVSDENGDKFHCGNKADKNNTQKTGVNTVTDNQTDNGDFSQKSLGCLLLSPDSTRNFSDCSPSRIAVQNSPIKFKRSADGHPERNNLPVFETSWSDDSSLFDTSPVGLNKMSLHVEKPNFNVSNIPRFSARCDSQYNCYQRGENIEGNYSRPLRYNCDPDSRKLLENTYMVEDVEDHSLISENIVTSLPQKTTNDRYRSGAFPQREPVYCLSSLPHPSELTRGPSELRHKNKDLSQKINEKMESYKMRGSVTGMVAKRQEGSISQRPGICSNFAPSITFSQMRRNSQRRTTQVELTEESSDGDWLDDLHREHKDSEQHTAEVMSMKKKQGNERNFSVGMNPYNKGAISGQSDAQRTLQHSYSSHHSLLETEDQILTNMSNNNNSSSTVTGFHSQDEEICKDSAYGQPRKMCFSSPDSVKGHKIALRSQPFEDQFQISDSSPPEISMVSSDLIKTTMPEDELNRNQGMASDNLDNTISTVSKWGQYMPVEDENDHDIFDCSYDFNSSLPHKPNNASLSDCDQNKYNQIQHKNSLGNIGKFTASQTINTKIANNVKDTLEKARYSFKSTSHLPNVVHGENFHLESQESNGINFSNVRGYLGNTDKDIQRNEFSSPSANYNQRNSTSQHQDITKSVAQCVGMSPDIICLGSSPSLYHQADLKSPASHIYSLESSQGHASTPQGQTVPEETGSWGSSTVSSPVGQIVPEVPTDSTGESVLHCLERKFNPPVINPTSSPNLLLGTKRSLWDDLQFASLSEVESNPTPVRKIVIPTMFSSPLQYKQILVSALREHLNIILFALSKQYHQAMSKTDTSSLTFPAKNIGGNQSESAGTPLPPCLCGVSSKLVQVRKEGSNKGRFFYSCANPANQRCKFFQWADCTSSVGLHHHGGSRIRLTDPAGVTAHLRQHRVMFYCQSQFLQKSLENILGHFKNPWAKQKYQRECKMQKKHYLRLSRKDSSTLFSKDDLWIVSRDLSFDLASTFLAKSTYYGPTSGNEVEIEPISRFSPSNWNNEAPCHAILAGNVSSELSYLDNIQDNLQHSSVPILSQLLSVEQDDALKRTRGFLPPRLSGQKRCNIHVPMHAMDELVKEFMGTYSLNVDQGTALRRLAAMFCDGTHSNLSSILLIHGVFGAGKSFLLSVMIQFLVRVFKVNGSYTPGLPYPWKILISSTTNVAVDRVLMGLQDIGFEDFVRVGSMKKIAKPVLPNSVHATGTESQELKDLQEMLRSGDLSQSEKHNVRQSIEKHKLGENKKKLGSVPVVGVTCASCGAPSLKDLKFPVVILDECSQMTEPASLLPVSKFACEKLVLVGDPKQLDPTIQGSEACHTEGLEQTLFDRLIKMGHLPTMLRTQYRCHPVISDLANSLFYQGHLLDGIQETNRKPVLDILPILCFYDVSNGQESSDSSGSFSNEKEADFVSFLIEVLLNAGVDAASIGVITLYKSQMYSILVKLGTSRNCSQKDTKSVLVSTVDAFQGGEKDIIILSCVRTNNTGFIDNHKRTNVALTRARNHLFIVGNLRNLVKNQLWGKVIAMCKARTDGVQSSEAAQHMLSSLHDQASQESALSPRSRSPKAGKKGKRKRQEEEGESPPMSLSGQSGTPIDDSPVTSSFRETMPVKQSKRRRELPQIDVTQLDSDKENAEQDSEDEELPAFTL